MVMSWRSGNTREYTLISLYWVTVSPVSSFTSLWSASCRVSPFFILPPGNHHSPLAG